MIRLFILLSLSLQAFADIHQIELACIPDHIFNIHEVDREEGLVFLTVSKKLETGLQMIAQAPIDHEGFFVPWYSKYNIDDTLYPISENEYAIGVVVYNSCHGTGGGTQIEQLQLFQFKSDTLKPIFTGTLWKESHLYGHDEEGRSGTDEESKATFTISPTSSNGYFDLSLTTKKHTEHFDDGIDEENDGLYCHIQSNTSTWTQTETFAWDGSTYRKK